MRELRRNRPLFDFLALDLAYDGWKHEQHVKEIEEKNNPKSTFKMVEGEEDEDTQDAYRAWLFADKPLPDELEPRPTIWRKTPPPVDVEEIEEETDYEKLSERLKNFRSERG